MDADTPPAGDIHLIVGYDGSPPAVRALNSAVGLMRGRTGQIHVVYIAHMPAADSLSADALAEMEVTFDEIEQELRAEAEKALQGREERWDFQRRYGPIAAELIVAATHARDTHPGDTVAIVVGSSSTAAHRFIGSVAVSLARHSPVPLMIVP
jgi:nucleotide-binding universal stress UspA family protein